MRIVVMAYHNIGYTCLEYLIRQGEEIVAVVTHADDPGEKVWFKSVRELAFAHFLPIYQPKKVNHPGFIEVMRRLCPDLIFSFYFRQILSPELLKLPPLGGINLHGSLLPAYRGRCPINWVLINGEEVAGVTLHYMEEKADSGDIISQREVPILWRDNALTLHGKMEEAARLLLQETFPLIKNGTAPRIPQDPSRASYYGGRKPEDGLIDWAQPAFVIYNLVRAVTDPYPGAFTHWNGKPLFIWESDLEPDSEPRRAGSPGQVTRILPGRGFSVTTGKGELLVIKASWGKGRPMRADLVAKRVGINQGSTFFHS